MLSCSVIVILIFLVRSPYIFLLFNQSFHHGIFLLISFYPTPLRIMLVAHISFFIYHRINFIHIHSSHDSILHRPSLTRPLGFHLFLIRHTLVFLLQNMLLMFSSFLPHHTCSIILVLKGLYNKILPILPLSRPQSSIPFIHLPNHLIFRVLILSMDGSVSPSKM